jgi:high-affinity nickel-transport protein
MIELAGDRRLRVVDLGRVGYLVLAIFVATWAVSLAYWKARRVEQRWKT